MAIIVGGAALFVASEFFIPVALSLLLSALLWPVVAQLQRWRIPTVAGSAIAILATVAILVGAGAAVQQPVRNFANNIPKTIAAARPRIIALTASVSRMMGSTPARKGGASPVAPASQRPTPKPLVTPPSDSSRDSTDAAHDSVSVRTDSAARNAQVDFVARGVTKSDSTTSGSNAPKPKARTDKTSASGESFDLSAISREAPATLSKALGIASSLIGDFVEIMLLAMFVLAAGSAWKSKVSKSVSSSSRADTIADTVGEMRRAVSRYVFMTMLINVGQGIVVALALNFLGYPSAALWGVLTFALEFIPYLGGMVMVALLFTAGLAAGRDFSAALYGPAAYLLVTTLQNNVLSPVAYGRSLKLNPVAILAGLMLWYMLWGVAGAFLAVPILAAFNVLASRVPSLAGAHEFLSD
jgi:predicted PurR-regulated permease PerM